MKAFRFIAGSFGIALLMIIFFSVMPAQTKPQEAGAAAEPYDHSNCQYPYRWTNPADGCDNSDPAVPECIKAAYSRESEDACIAKFVEQYKEQQPKPVDTPAIEVAPEQPAAAPVTSCGGK